MRWVALLWGALQVAFATAVWADPSLTGTWLLRTEQMEVRAEFRADGTFERTTRADGQTEIVRGTYRVLAGAVEITPSGGGEVIRMNLRLPDAQTLELTDESGAGVRMVRVESAPAPDRPGNPLAARKPEAGRTPDAVSTRFIIHSCIDEGGIRDPQTGQFMTAFRILVPQGWKFSGGTQWVYNTKAPQALTPTDQIMPLKIAFVVSSPDGRCAVESYLQQWWADVSRTPAAQAGLTNFPIGSDYRGMIVCPPMPPEQYIAQYVIPRQRGISAVRIIKQDDAGELAQRFAAEQQRFNELMNGAGLAAGISFRAAALTVEYETGGAAFRERFVAILQYMETDGIIMWWPRINFSSRALREEFEAWQPVFQAIVTSVENDPAWQVEFNRMVNRGAGAVADADAYVNKVYRQILDHRAATNSEIGRGMGPLIHPWHYYEGTDGRKYFLDTGKHHFMNAEGELMSQNSWEAPIGWKEIKPYIQPYHEN